MKANIDCSFTEEIAEVENDRKLLRNLVLKKLGLIQEAIKEQKKDRLNLVRNLSALVTNLELRSYVSKKKGKKEIQANLDELIVEIDNWAFNNLDSKRLEIYAKEL